LASRRKAALAAGLLASFSGYLITDGYAGYRHLLSRLAGIQQCCTSSGGAGFPVHPYLRRELDE